MARTRQDHPSRPMEATLNIILAAFRKQAIHQGTDQYGRWSGSVSDLIGQAAELSPSDTGKRGHRYKGTSTYTGPLYFLKLIVPLSPALSGNATRGRETVPAVYLVDMKRRVTRSDVLKWRVHNNAQQELWRERRQQKALQERAAGDTPDQTTGGPISERHFHDNLLDHEHVDQGELKTGPHAHEGTKDEPGAPLWPAHPAPERVEYRHHTHTAKDTNGTGGAVHREPVEDPASGRQVMQVGPERDGRYTKLLDIVADLEAKLRRADTREEGYLATIREQQQMLTDLTDPSASQADEVLERYGKA